MAPIRAKRHMKPSENGYDRWQRVSLIRQIHKPWPRVPTLKDQELLPEAEVLSDQRGPTLEKLRQCRRRPSNHHPLHPQVIRGTVSHLISSGGSARWHSCARQGPESHEPDEADSKALRRLYPQVLRGRAGASSLEKARATRSSMKAAWRGWAVSARR